MFLSVFAKRIYRLVLNKAVEVIIHFEICIGIKIAPHIFAELLWESVVKWDSVKNLTDHHFQCDDKSPDQQNRNYCMVNWKAVAKTVLEGGVTKIEQKESFKGFRWWVEELSGYLWKKFQRNIWVDIKKTERNELTKT